jgi:hypothetical protein
MPPMTTSNMPGSPDPEDPADDDAELERLAGGPLTDPVSDTRTDESSEAVIPLFSDPHRDRAAEEAAGE